MKLSSVLYVVIGLVILVAGCGEKMTVPPQTHPDVSKWQDLFAPDLSNAVYADSVWSIKDGVLTAAYDACIWTKQEYDNFILDLEFMTYPGTNSGVIVYCTDTENWIPHSVEIQIADDYAEQWANAGKTWQCGAIFGHLGATKSLVKKAGEWNRYTITCQDKMIYIMLNGEMVTTMDMSLWTSATMNPDSTEIPSWLSTPFAELPTRGYIGFQGKHADAPISFRNIKIHVLE